MKAPVPRFLAVAGFAFLLVPLLALDCDGAGPAGPATAHPALTDLPGSYRIGMTVRSVSGGAGGCPTTNYTFEEIALTVNASAGMASLAFTFPVGGEYDASTGAFTAIGRAESSITGFELEFSIDGVFTEENGDVLLSGISVFRLVAEATGAEFCRTELGVEMERTGS